jgi:hypothetical protein
MTSVAEIDDMLGMLLIALGLAVGAVSLISLMRTDRLAHRRLLRQVCKELRVGSADQRLLRAMARSANLPSPVSLALSRGCFDYATQLHLVRHFDARDRIAHLRAMIFD